MRVAKGLAAKPYWFETALPRFPALHSDIDVDVAIVGGGVTGLTAGYLLAREGVRVAIVDRARLASVDTGHTTSHLTYVTDYRLHELVKTFGKDRARAFWRAGADAIDTIESIATGIGADCDFKRAPGYLHEATHDGTGGELDRLRRDCTLANELGFSASFADAVPYFNVPGICFEQQAKFHPRKYLKSLIEEIRANGGRIFENTRYEEVTDKPLAVRANGARIKCEYVIIATHNPLMGLKGLLGATLFQTKLSLYSSFVVAAKLPPDALPEALFWDTADPYDYLRVDSHADHQYAIFGGEDAKTGHEGNAEHVFDKMSSRFVSLFPEAKISHRWMGQVVETDDGLPFIGESAPRQFIATGFCGNGYTLGTVAACMARDRFFERDSEYGDLFRVDRKPIHGGLWRYMKENADFPAQLIKDRLRKSALRVEDLGNCEGGIVMQKGERIAAYRADDGELQLCSPTCTHLGCLVKWNSVDKTWDCPCHGSRFKPDGAVLSGPAEESLERLRQPRARKRRKSKSKRSSA